jgi:hypothetical protein
MSSIRLGDLLVKAKVITEMQLRSALAEQQKWGGRLGEILVRMQIVTEEMMVKALSKQLNVAAVNLDSISAVPPHVRDKLPAQTAEGLTVVPLQLRDEGKTLVVAMSEPQNIRHMDTLRAVTKCRIIPQLAGRQSIARALARFYGGEEELGADEGSFKVLNSQGSTLIKSVDQIEREGRERRAAAAPKAAATSAATPAPRAEAAAPARSAVDTLRAVEDAQRRELAALKAMVELLVEKGVFTREEYAVKVKR